jgi:probable rRNA maturation factor
MPSRIYFFKSGVRFRFKNKESISNWIKKVIRKDGKQPGEISFIFCTDKFLLDINKQYLNHDYFTDIITFDYCERDKINGEIYISIDRVRENALSMKVDFLIELNRVMIHGILHLLGYPDKKASHKKQMRKREDACLSLLRSST